METVPGEVTPNHSSPPVLRLAAVDDHEIILRGLSALAATHPDELVMVAQGTTVAALEQAIGAREVDVILVDLQMGDVTVEQALSLLCRHTERLLIYTAAMQPVPIRRAIAAGAQGIALKSDSEQALLEAIREVAAGNFAVSGELAHVLATDEALAPHLPPRELEALALLASGVPKKSVGKHMQPPCGEATVATYLNRVCKRYAELGRPVGGVHEAVREATRDGYLEL